MAYRRDSVTWAAFGALFGFGYLNAVLGPALPFLRRIEHISYLVGSLHQVAFAIGGGVAGVIATRPAAGRSRTAPIAIGLSAAALAGLGVGYGRSVLVTVPAAFVMSLCGTTALIRLWAVLADEHGERRTIAMAEGEVSVSLAGIVTPLLISALAATALSWRFAFVLGAAAVGLASATVLAVRMPAAEHVDDSVHPAPPARRRGLPPTLVTVFAIVGLEFALSFWLASYLNDSVHLSRTTAVSMVAVLYAANLVGRLLASRLARRVGATTLLIGSLGIALAGFPLLLSAHGAILAAAGLAISGTGIGACFPLASSLHVSASPRSADGSIGQVLAVAATGEMSGPLLAGVVAQAAGLRTGLLVLPAFAGLALIATAAAGSPGSGWSWPRAARRR